MALAGLLRFELALLPFGRLLPCLLALRSQLPTLLRCCSLALQAFLLGSFPTQLLLAGLGCPLGALLPDCRETLCFRSALSCQALAFLALGGLLLATLGCSLLLGLCSPLCLRALCCQFGTPVPRSSLAFLPLTLRGQLLLALSLSFSAPLLRLEAGLLAPRCLVPRLYRAGSRFAALLTLDCCGLLSALKGTRSIVPLTLDG